jgi:hypothetical protein
LTTISDAAITLSSTGANSNIDISSLTDMSLTDINSYTSRYTQITASSGGSITVSNNLTVLENVWLSIATDADLINFDTSKITSIKKSIIIANGVTLDFTNCEELVVVSFQTQNNGVVNLPVVKNLDGGIFWDSSYSSSYTGSVNLGISALVTIKDRTISADAVTLDYTNCETLENVTITTTNGGVINLPKLTSWDGSYSRTFPLPSDSLVYDISKVKTISYGTITADGITLTLTDCKTLDNVNLVTKNGGVINLPNLETWKSSSTAALPNTSIGLDWAKIKSLTYATITADGETIDLTNCEELINVTITTKNGGIVNLPSLKKIDNISFSGTVNYSDAMITSIKNTTITANNVTRIFSNVTELFDVSLTATNGGVIQFPLVTHHTIDNQARTWSATGTGSKIEFSAMTDINVSTSENSTYLLTLTATTGGQIVFPASIDSLQNIALTFDANTSTTLPNLSVSQITSIKDSSITANGVILDFVNCSELEITNLTAQNGGTIKFPQVTSSSGRKSSDVIWQATGTGSRIELAALETIDYTNISYMYHVRVNATNGGVVDLSALSSVDSLTISSSGSGSNVDISSLVNLKSTSERNSISTTSNGFVTVHNNITELDNVMITLADPSDWINFDVSKITSVKNTSITLNSGTLDFSNCTTLEESYLTAQNGAVIKFPQITTFNSTTSNTRTWTVTGAGSRIEFVALTTFTTSTMYFSAASGGTFVMPNVQFLNNVSITVNNSFVEFGSCEELSNVKLTAQNGGVIKFPKATTYTTADRTPQTWTATGTGSEIIFNRLTKLIIPVTNVAQLLDISASSNGVVSLPVLLEENIPEKVTISGNVLCGSQIESSILSQYGAFEGIVELTNIIGEIFEDIDHIRLTWNSDGQQTVFGTVNRNGSWTWNTTLFSDAAGVMLIECFDQNNQKQFEYNPNGTIINNDANIVIHRGDVTDNETWAADKVHLVTGEVTVVNGKTLTIAENAVVKFWKKSYLNINNGATLSVQNDAILTLAEDDTVGGDTNKDGSLSVPKTGNYLRGTGNFSISTTAKLKYLLETKSGTISQSETWLGGRVYHITGNITVTNNATLTILPGAIIKFDPNCSLAVNSGATLIAEGTAAQPIIFTSIKDDAYGGDTNEDGDKTRPQAGDWRYISANGGTIILNYTRVSYCSDTNNAGGLYMSSGSIKFDNSVIAYTKYDGMRATGGTFTATNSVFTESSMAVSPRAGTANGVFTNCTFVNNTTAIRGTGTFINCVFANVTSIFEEWGPSIFENCVFWNPKGSGPQTVSAVGSNGNIWADPMFRDVVNGDYHLRAGSPLIDAADSSKSSANDISGVVRVNDPYTTDKRGIADANGIYADIGAYEFTDNASSSVDLEPVDLEPVDLKVPASVTVGETITIQWTIRNNGSDLVSGSWTDLIQLVSDTGQVVNVGEVGHSGYIIGGDLQTYYANVVVPSVAEGNWKFAIQANVNRNIFEGVLISNNLFNVATSTAVAVPLLTEKNGNLVTSKNNPALYKINIAAGETFYFTASSSDPISIRLSENNAPTATASDYVASTDGKGNYALYVPADSVTRTVYLLVSAERNNADVAFSIKNETLGIAATSTSNVSNKGTSTIAFIGGGFDSTISVALKLGGTTIDGTALNIVDGSNGSAQFNLQGVAAGTYNLVITKGGQTVTLDNAVTVKADGIGANLIATLDIPDSVRVGRTYLGYIVYENKGDCDMLLPVFTIRSNTGTLVGLTADSLSAGSEVHILGLGSTSSAGVLRPGETGKVAFYFQATNNTNISLSTWVSDDVSTPLFTNTYWTTWEAYHRDLSATVTQLALRGYVTSNYNDLKLFLFAQKAGENTTGLSGNLRNSTTGESIENATLLAEWIVNGEIKTAITTTNENGFYIFNRLPANASVTISLLDTAYDLSVTTVQISDNKDVTNFNLTAKQFGSISGQITDENGNGLEGVYIIAGSDNNTGSFTVTDSSGHYTITNLSLNDYKIYAIQLDGYSFKNSVSVINSIGNTGVNFQIDSALLPDYSDVDENTSTSQSAATFAASSLAAKVIYLDFNGGVFTHPNLNNGLTITSPPAQSHVDKAAVISIVQELYAPFNVIVTDDLSVFNNAAQNAAIRVVIGGDPTDWISNGGGGGRTATLNDFSKNNICFVFDHFDPTGTNSIGILSEVIAIQAVHEVGHTFGLWHDAPNGTGNGNYYKGHGNWTAIMGTPNGNIAQFSKNIAGKIINTEDDLAIIAGVLGVKDDDHSDTIPTPLDEIFSDDNQTQYMNSGIIGLTSNGKSGDVDVFSFSIPDSKNSSAPASTEFYIQSGTSYAGINYSSLFWEATLKKSDGSEVKKFNVSNLNSLSAYMTIDLDPGDYLLEIRGAGDNNNNPPNAYEYGSIGTYVVVVTVLTQEELPEEDPKKNQGSSTPQSCDPNEIAGLVGYDFDAYNSGTDEEPMLVITSSNWVNNIQQQKFSVFFENKSSATAAAQEVFVTMILPQEFDYNTLSLGEINIGGQIFTVAENGSTGTWYLNQTSTGEKIKVTVTFNESTRELKWYLRSYVANTVDNFPIDAYSGFLPPNDETDRGQAYVSFNINLLNNVTTDTIISTSATIVFDTNEPITTNIWKTTIDANRPESSVIAFVSNKAATQFEVDWSGTDVGSGVASYDIYVSDNGGAFELWLPKTTDTSGLYFGTIGHTYSFYSIAYDNTGLAESKPSPTAEATVTVTHEVGALDTPENLRTQQSAKTTLALDWNTIADATQYELQRKTDGGSFVTVYTGINSDFVDSGLTANTQYIYQVRAFNASGSSVFSDEFKVTTLGGAASHHEQGFIVDIPMVTNINVDLDSNKTTLTWSHLGDDYSYYVFRNGSLVSVAQAGTSYVDNNPSETVRYLLYAYHKPTGSWSKSLPIVQSRASIKSEIVSHSITPQGGITLNWNIPESQQFVIFRNGIPVSGNVSGQSWTDTMPRNGDNQYTLYVNYFDQQTNRYVWTYSKTYVVQKPANAQAAALPENFWSVYDLDLIDDVLIAI